MAGTLCTLLPQSFRKQQSVFCCPQNFQINGAGGWRCLSGFKSILNMHLISLVLKPVVWNEQYSLRVKTVRVLHPQKGKRGTEAPSDLLGVTLRLHGEAGTPAYSFSIFKLEANTEGLWSTKRKEDSQFLFSVASQDKPENTEWYPSWFVFLTMCAYLPAARLTAACCAAGSFYSQ